MEYYVNVDIIMNKMFYVDAANKNEAIADVIRRVKEEPHYHVGSADAFVAVDVVACDEACTGIDSRDTAINYLAALHPRHSREYIAEWVDSNWDYTASDTDNAEAYDMECMLSATDNTNQ